MAAGAKVEGEQIIFADEWQVERCVSLAVKSTSEALGDMNREPDSTPLSSFALVRAYPYNQDGVSRSSRMSRYDLDLGGCI